MKHLLPLFVFFFWLPFFTTCFADINERKSELGLKDYVAIIRPDFKIGVYYFLNAPGETDPIREKGAELMRKNYQLSTINVFMTHIQNDQELGINTFNFSLQDRRYMYLKEANMDICLHLLAGPNEYNPNWFVAEFNEGKYTAEQMEEVLVNRIRTIMTHKIDGKTWNIWAVHVANESFRGDRDEAHQPNPWRGPDADVWVKALGFETGANGYRYPKYLRVAFEAARRYGGPDVKLIYSDDRNAMWSRPKAEYCLDLFNNFRELGIPIDGIAVQFHSIIIDGVLYAENNGNRRDPIRWDDVDRYFTMLGEAGAEVHVSEFEVRIQRNDPTQEELELQAQAYRDALKTCMENPFCTVFQAWYKSDRYTPNLPDHIVEREQLKVRYGNSSMFDRNFDPKPAYYAMLDYLIEKSKEIRVRQQISQGAVPSP